jgi:hypothetical protein
MHSRPVLHGFCGARLAGARAALLGLAFAGGLVTAAPPALAQGAPASSQEDLERARSLFRQGLSLEAAGNWAAALSKFQDVAKVKLTPQVRFHSARCSEQLGRLNEALGEYRLAEYEAGQQGLPELAAIAQSRQALEGRVPKLIIRRGKGTESARIQLDGTDLGESQIGQPIAVDPGPHSVNVRLSPGREFQQAAVVKESETVEVPLVAPDQGASPAVAGAPPAGADHGGAPPKGGSAVPWIIGGVGVAGLAASGVFYVLRQGAKSDLDSACRGSLCPSSVQDTQSRGQTYTTVSMVALGVGVVGVGVATYLLVTGSSSGSGREQAFVPVDVVALPSGGSVTVRARF